MKKILFFLPILLLFSCTKPYDIETDDPSQHKLEGVWEAKCTLVTGSMSGIISKKTEKLTIDIDKGTYQYTIKEEGYKLRLIDSGEIKMSFNGVWVQNNGFGGKNINGKLSYEYKSDKDNIWHECKHEAVFSTDVIIENNTIDIVFEQDNYGIFIIPGYTQIEPDGTESKHLTLKRIREST